MSYVIDGVTLTEAQAREIARQVGEREAVPTVPHVLVSRCGRRWFGIPLRLVKQALFGATLTGAPTQMLYVTDRGSVEVSSHCDTDRVITTDMATWLAKAGK